MKLATFARSSGTRIGAVLTDDEQVLDLQRAHELVKHDRNRHFEDMLALIDGGAKALDAARRLVEAAPDEALIPLEQLMLLAPIPEPRQVRDFMSFEAHLRNCLDQIEKTTGEHREIPPVWYEQPVYYKANRFATNGPDADVLWPSYAEILDFELELACVIGTTGVDIPRDQARKHVFGYTIFNDVSARDAQMREMQAQLGPAKGKDFDTGNVFGPWIVTADEIRDPYDLDMTVRVNGERWGGGSSRDMHHRFEDAIAHVSRSETLYAGEILGSGTVGTGCGLELGRFPQPGDVVELEIERIGVLRNRFVK